MEEEGEVVEQEQLKLVREVAKQEETSVSHGNFACQFEMSTVVYRTGTLSHQVKIQ